MTTSNKSAIIKDFFWTNKFNLSLISFSILLNILLWLLLFWRIKPQETPIFLHYNIYYGIDLIGEWWRAYLYLPGSGLIFIIFNTVLAFFVYKKEKIVSYFLLGFALIYQAIFLVAGLFTIMLNLGR